MRLDRFGGKALGIDWGSEIQADAVHATVRHFGPAPLIPPLRIYGYEQLQ